MNKKKLTSIYIICDLLFAGIVWLLFFIFRKIEIEPLRFGYSIPIVLDKNFYIGVVVISSFWALLHYFSGFYDNVYRKNISTVVFHTFIISLIGALLIFYLVILDDTVLNYKNYYTSILALFILQFIFIIIPRIIIVSNVLRQIRNGKVQFKTLMIGCGQEAFDVFNELTANTLSGNLFTGYLSTIKCQSDKLNGKIPLIGKLEDLPRILKNTDFDEIIVALDESDEVRQDELINWLGFVEVPVLASPSLHSVLKGEIKIYRTGLTTLIEVNDRLLPGWQKKIKLVIDKLVSIIVLLVLSPVYLFLFIAVKLTSHGPALLKQERIGKHGKPFKLFKFRSMYLDAEKEGPNLATKNDSRVTPFGRFMRQTKLDELPNFWNVLIGDMALVGPRPERQFYIDQLVKVSPIYMQVQKIKPGITSLGQVKFGYAENVEQMIQRLRYDILYMENMSIYLDLKILFYTFIILFKGRHI